MIEQTFSLEDIVLIDFLGVEDANIRELGRGFPTTKIIPRGNELILRGSEDDLIKLKEHLEALEKQYHRLRKITIEDVQSLLGTASVTTFVGDNEAFLYGNKGVVIRMKTANQKAMVEAIAKHDVVFAVGPAGTGKTYTAVAIAVKALKNKEVKKIIITRPAVEAGENLGFLPGDLKEKIDPYLRPIYDALDDMIPPDKLKLYIENRTIEIAPLAYMRGRTLNNAFILLDEAQNTTTMQLKMFLTRMGPIAKVIITGDKTQVDLPTKMKSGLSEALRILEGVPGIALVELDGRDIVRHRLVRLIVEAYEKAQ